MPADLVAFDTNVLVYGLVDLRDADKTRTSRELLQMYANGSGVVSTQAIQEFANVCTKKLRRYLSTELLLEYLDGFRRYKIVSVDPALIRAAVHRQVVNQISYYDSLIVEAALSARTQLLYSEDLQHGMSFGTLRVVNPYL